MARSGQAATGALAALGRAIQDAAVALRSVPADDEATAFRCAKPLDAALADLIALLDSVPVITGLGDPAPAVRDRLERSRSDLYARRADITSYRNVLDEFTQVREELAVAAGTASDLQQQVTTLRRDRALAEEVPRLRGLVQELESDVAALDVPDAVQVGERLDVALERLATLGERQRAVMGDAAEAMIARAQAAARDLDDLKARTDLAAADVARRESDAKELMELHGDTLVMLETWSKANQAVADGLRDVLAARDGRVVEPLRDELGGITLRLAALDDALAPLLAEHARAYEEARKTRGRSF
ncbi:MAG TPA: hypothetical protein VH478_01210 [Trebonia sp.]|jgi:hypothetical protein|nr:hypothetical protein [Trebonia sp.]